MVIPAGYLVLERRKVAAVAAVPLPPVPAPVAVAVALPVAEKPVEVTPEKGKPAK
jgi:hypothetical protein